MGAFGGRAVFALRRRGADSDVHGAGVDSSNESLDKKNKDLTNKSDVLAKTQAALTEASVFEATSGGTSATSARCLARSTP